ncbi:MAG TPA: hypothetical protein VFK38_08390, partial [Candidatus Limnocylindrales bacterium]|nr:hypothetical protein [Candidatus Limnocylindrales bacterium]
QGTPPTDPGNGTPPTDPGNGTPPTDPGNGTPPADPPGQGTPPADPGNGTPPTDPGQGTPPADPGNGTPPTDPGQGTPPTDPGNGTPPTDPGNGTTRPPEDSPSNALPDPDTDVVAGLPGGEPDGNTPADAAPQPPAPAAFAASAPETRPEPPRQRALPKPQLKRAAFLPDQGVLGIVSGVASHAQSTIRPAAAAAVATTFGFPFVLMQLVLIFLVVQSRLDARDPKLRESAPSPTDSLVPFDDEDDL